MRTGRRKGKSERRALDHYVTPDWAVRRFLEEYYIPRRGDDWSAPVPVREGERPLRILDPCAAQGELLTVAKEYHPDALVAAGEINADFEADLTKVTEGAVVIGDFLETSSIFKQLEIDLVLTNPPYAQAEAFVRASLEVAPVVAMLLRINFLASQTRRDWLAFARPGLFVLPNRPSFTGGGGDMTEYAWFVFGDSVVAGQLEFLALTPPEEIKEANRRAKEICGAGDDEGDEAALEAAL